MNKQIMEPSPSPLETQLTIAAREFPYPSTPDIAGWVRPQLAGAAARPDRPARRLVWPLAAAALALILVLAVPPLRTVVWQAVRQGAVQVFQLESDPTATPLVTITPAVSAEAPATASPVSLTTPRPLATPAAALMLFQPNTPAASSRQVSPLPAPRPPNEKTTPPASPFY
jgi:hypothetical protein